MVAPDRLRFDFTHFAAVTPEELAAIEAEVNAKILANLVVQADMMSYDEAIAQGATALFDEKYGDAVRVISIADYSQELCGGTHVRQTGEIGLLKILSEGAVAAGVRRIEAVTGKAALQHVAEGERILNQVAQELQTTPREVVEKLERLQLQIKQLERENASLQEKLAASSASERGGAS